MMPLVGSWLARGTSLRHFGPVAGVRELAFREPATCDAAVAERRDRKGTTAVDGFAVMFPKKITISLYFFHVFFPLKLFSFRSHQSNPVLFLRPHLLPPSSLSPFELCLGSRSFFSPGRSKPKKKGNIYRGAHMSMCVYVCVRACAFSVFRFVPRKAIEAIAVLGADSIVKDFLGAGVFLLLKPRGEIENLGFDPRTRLEKRSGEGSVGLTIGFEGSGGGWEGERQSTTASGVEVGNGELARL